MKRRDALDSYGMPTENGMADYRGKLMEDMAKASKRVV
jgi:hypothetical protein